MKKTSTGFSIIIILAVSLLAFCGCKGKQEAVPAGPVEGFQGQPEASGTPAPGVTAGTEGEDETAATVNGTVITRKEVNQATDGILQKYGNQIPPAQREMLRAQVQKQALENLINQQLLLEQAEKQGDKPDPKEVDARYNALAGRFPSPEEFQNLLATMGMTEKQFRDEIELNLKIEGMLQKKFDTLPEIGDAEVSAYYKEHPEDFKVPEMITASHILITTSEEDTPETKAEKRKQLAELKKEIDNGADFTELASQHSECPSKAKGGDLGQFERGKMVKPFEEAAFSLKKGEVSEIVETPFGYHLIKVTEIQTPRVMTLDEVKDKVRSYLDRQQKEKALNEYIEKLRGPAKIEYPEQAAP
jgi:peptidyl-prolyl cis-trans isomerase C